jgi:hypothetical protein
LKTGGIGRGIKIIHCNRSLKEVEVFHVLVIILQQQKILEEITEGMFKIGKVC